MRNNAIDQVVVSDTLTTDQSAPWHDTRIVKRADAHTQLAELKQQRPMRLRRTLMHE